MAFDDTSSRLLTLERENQLWRDYAAAQHKATVGLLEANALLLEIISLRLPPPAKVYPLNSWLAEEPVNDPLRQVG